MRYQQDWSGVQVLVAMEPRSYREAIGCAITGLRPDIEVSVVEPEMLLAETARLEPEVVIHSRPEEPLAGVVTWIALPEDTALPATLYRGGRSSEVPDFDLEKLLAVLDETFLITQVA